MTGKDATLAFFQTKIVKDQSRPSCFQLNRFTGHMLPGLFSTAATKTNAFVAACQWTEADKAVLPSWIGLPYQPLATRGGFSSDEFLAPSEESQNIATLV